MKRRFLTLALLALFAWGGNAQEKLMDITVTIGGNEYAAALYDNGAARAVSAQFPLALSMSEYAGNLEYYARLSAKITADAPKADKIRAGDIMLYNDISLVIFYADAPHTAGYVKLGHIENPADLKKSLDGAGGKVRFSVANGTAKTDETARLQDLYREMWKILIAKDADGMRRIHGEDFVLVHMTGSRMNRAEFISAVKDGTLNYYTAEHDDISVKISGNKATLTGKSRVNAAVYGGGRHTWRLQQDMTLEKRGGAWVFTHSKASTY